MFLIAVLVFDWLIIFINRLVFCPIFYQNMKLVFSSNQIKQYNDEYASICYHGELVCCPLVRWNISCHVCLLNRRIDDIAGVGSHTSPSSNSIPTSSTTKTGASILDSLFCFIERPIDQPPQESIDIFCRYTDILFRYSRIIDSIYCRCTLEKFIDLLSSQSSDYSHFSRLLHLLDLSNDRFNYNSIFETDISTLKIDDKFLLISSLNIFDFLINFFKYDNKTLNLDIINETSNYIITIHNDNLFYLAKHKYYFVVINYLFSFFDHKNFLVFYNFSKLHKLTNCNNKF